MASPRIAMLSAFVAVLATAVAVSGVLRAGRDLRAPDPLPTHWVLAGDPACVGSGEFKLSQSGIFVHLTSSGGALGSLEGRIDAGAFTAEGRGAGVPGALRMDGTWTALGLVATVDAPADSPCHGATLRGAPAR